MTSVDAPASWIESAQRSKLLGFDEPRERLSQCDMPRTVELLASSVPRKLCEQILKNLPQIDGFDNTRKAGQERQKLKIAEMVTSPDRGGGRVRYLNAYRKLWWSATTQRVGPWLNSHFNYQDVWADEAASQLAETLTANHARGYHQAVSRETVEDILILSPLQLTSESKDIAAKAPLDATLKQESEFAALSSRIDDLTATLAQQVDLFAEARRSFEARTLELESQVSETLALISSQRSFGTPLAEVGTVNEALDDKILKFEALTASLDLRIKGIESRLDDNTMQPLMTDLQGKLHLLTPESKEIRAVVSEMGASRQPTLPADRLEGQSVRNAHGLDLEPRYAVLSHDTAAGVHELEQWSDLYAAANRLLTARGADRRRAAVFAAAIVAAIHAGQMPIFVGSLAECLAFDVCELVIGGPIVGIDLPLGCNSPIVMHEVSRLGGTCAIVSGLARVSVDVVGGNFRTSALRVQLGWEAPGLPAIGTFEAGPAALPITFQVLELGPLLDTDCGLWKRPAGSSNSVERARASDSLLGQRSADVPEANTDYLGDIEQTIAAMKITGTAAWRAGVFRFARSLELVTHKSGSTQSDGMDPDQLASIIERCWIVPMLAAEEPDATKRLRRWKDGTGDVSTAVKEMLTSPTMRQW